MARTNFKLPRLSFDWLSDIGGRRIALYTLYTIVLFLVFLLVNFPHAALVDRALSSIDMTPFSLEIADTRFAWWKGYEFSGVRLLQHGSVADQPPVIESTRLYVRPALRGLMRGQLTSIDLNGLMYNGVVQGSVDERDGKSSVRMRFDRMQIQKYPLIIELLESGEISGLLSGLLTVEARRGSLSTLQGSADLNLKDASMIGAKVGGVSVPTDLHFALGSLKASLKGGRVEVQTLQLDGDEVKVQGSGQIVLREAIADSVLNLRLSIEPGAAGGDIANTVIALLNAQCRGGKAGRDASITLSGTIAHPRCR